MRLPPFCYRLHYKLCPIRAQSECGAGANVIDNHKVGLYKQRLNTRTGYAFTAFGGAPRPTARLATPRKWRAKNVTIIGLVSNFQMDERYIGVQEVTLWVGAGV